MNEKKRKNEKKMWRYMNLDIEKGVKIINRWMFSTNHKDIGTLYLIFSILAGIVETLFTIIKKFSKLVLKKLMKLLFKLLSSFVKNEYYLNCNLSLRTVKAFTFNSIQLISTITEPSLLMQLTPAEVWDFLVWLFIPDDMTLESFVCIVFMSVISYWYTESYLSKRKAKAKIEDDRLEADRLAEIKEKMNEKMNVYIPGKGKGINITKDKPSQYQISDGCYDGYQQGPIEVWEKLGEWIRELVEVIINQMEQLFLVMNNTPLVMYLIILYLIIKVWKYYGGKGK